jgi:hypothetical protein
VCGNRCTPRERRDEACWRRVFFDRSSKKLLTVLKDTLQ